MNNQRLTEGFLFTDQYQLTMAQLYFRMGLHEVPAQFEHFFRRYPDYGSHEAGYCINAGLEPFVDWIQQTRVTDDDIDQLRHQRNVAGEQVFADDFLSWLKNSADFSALTIHAVPEGRVVHPYLPLTVVEGPMAIAQLLETSLLNHLNYPTLVATKAARISDSARGCAVLEFGLRRAQGFGGNAGTRAALIGGADFTSNVGMSHSLGLQPKGTHAHSMVQLFMAMGMTELDAFRAYADVYPDDCLLLVDTINTLEIGIPNALTIFNELVAKGHKPVGIRIDSGDLAYLSIQAAKMLNEAGFPDTSIVLSDGLDELLIWQITTQISLEAHRYGIDASKLIQRLVYGVGTNLVTSKGEPALGGVFKLVAVQRENETEWRSAMKISESAAKMPNPGKKRVLRLYDQRDKATADLLCLHEEDFDPSTPNTLRHPLVHTRQRQLSAGEATRVEELLVPILDHGKVVHEMPDLETIRAQRSTDMERLDPGILRLVNPHIYHVSLTQELWDLKQKLIKEARSGKPS